MWTYCIAFSPDLNGFLMVRSRKRGGWEMPGGRTEEGETPLSSAIREFSEETGQELLTADDLSVALGEGMVFFGIIGAKKGPMRTAEIAEVSLFTDLPEDLAYPQEEYGPLLEKGKEMLARKVWPVT